MNALHKQYLILILFFSVSLFIPTYGEYHHKEYSHSNYQTYWCPPHIKMNLSLHQTHDSDLEESRSHADYSYDKTWDNLNCATPPTHRYHLSHYTASDFQNYFTAGNYSENEILNQRDLYFYDEFIKFAKTYPSYNAAIIKLYHELHSLSRIKKFLYTLTGSYSPKLNKRIHALYNEIKTPQEIDLPLLSQAINKRQEAYICANQQTKTYNINNSIKQLLHEHGYDTTPFTTCFGNQLQQAIHQESLDILAHINGLPYSSILYDHQSALVDFTAAITDYNHEGLTDQATQIADLCWTLLDYGQAVGEGIALGLYSAATDIINNPIEATICVIAGKQVLAYQLCKVLYNVADIGITALTNVDHAKTKWNDYIKPIDDIINAIKKKEITTRDVIKNGTAFVVGLKAQSKLLGGLGKFCNTVKQKSIAFAKKNSWANPQKYLTTPEGLLFKATVKSNKLKQSGQISASSLKTNVDNKIAKNKSIKRLIKQEGLPTKGKLRYVPPKKLHSFDRLPHEKLPGRKIGFIDRFGNLWVQGASRTKGQPHEWDVQLSRQGIQQVGWMTRDNSHLNVSLDGRVTHK